MFIVSVTLLFFFFHATATTEIYTLSLHDALPILLGPADTAVDLQVLDRLQVDGDSFDVRELGLQARDDLVGAGVALAPRLERRSEEHTSELQSQFHLVCRLLLEKKKKYKSSTDFV